MTSRLVALVLLVALAPGYADAATAIFASSLDSGTAATSAGPGIFPGGRSAYQPRFRAAATAYSQLLYPDGTKAYAGGTIALPGIGNRMVLDFDSSVTSSDNVGRDTYGVVTLGSGQTVLAAGAYLQPVLGTTGRCVGGSSPGVRCLPSTTTCGTGYCAQQRAPLISLEDSAGKRGCTLYLIQRCAGLTPTKACQSGTLSLQLLYGDPQAAVGRCGASKSMTDTICGGPCLVASDCLQGRPNAINNDGSDQTACLQNSTGATCTEVSDPSKCHCVEECDEIHPNEAVCTARIFSSIGLAQGATYAATVQQVIDGTCVGGSNAAASCTNASVCPGGACSFDNDVTCTVSGGPFKALCAAGTNPGAVCPNGDSDCLSGGAGSCHADLMQAFPRGAGTQKTGVCTGGSTLTLGGRKGTACSADADCACRRICVGGLAMNTVCASNGDCTGGGICQGPCTDGTCTGTAVCVGGTNAFAACAAASVCPGGTCSVPKVTPDRVVYGWDDGASDQARVFMDAYLIQTGTSPAIAWRPETVTADSSGTGLVQGWTGAGGACGSGSNWNCVAGNGTPSTEPDGNTTELDNHASNTGTWVHEWGFTNFVTTSGDTPVGTTFEVAVQDSESGNGDGAGVFLNVRVPSPSATAVPGPSLDVSGFEVNTTCAAGTNADTACVNDSECPGSSCTPDDGTQAHYYPAIPFTVAALPTGSYTIANINALVGRIEKYGPNGAADTIRATFSTLTQFFQTVTPTPPVVLPGNKRVGFVGDSLTNDPALTSVIASQLVEPSATYRQSAGGQSMGDYEKAAAALFEGGASGAFTTALISGTTVGPVDVTTIYISANTLRPIYSADPRNVTAFDGVGQVGWCEDWTNGVGYGSRQGLPCECNQTANWDSAGGVSGFFSLVKNANFGAVGSSACTTVASPSSECELGGTAPPGTATRTACVGTCFLGSNNGNACSADSSCPGGGLCSKGCAAGATGYAITAAANTRTIGAYGCKNVPGCPGVCVSGHSVARLLASKRRIEALAAASTAHSQLVWVTENPAPGSPDYFSRGWYEMRGGVDNWRVALLAEQKLTGGNWIDLAQYIVDNCGSSLLTKHAANTCIKVDGIHYTDQGIALYGNLLTSCLSNTDLNGLPNKVTDGVCTSGPTCSAGTCASGLRKGMRCSVNGDCSYCAGGAQGKLGTRCTADKDCGYYYCHF
jgi:hypothetical protein